MRLEEAALGDFLFSDAEAAPWRQETNTYYDVPSDGGDYDRYLAGEPSPDPRVGAEWRELLRAKEAQDRPVGRVRVLYDKPSPYLLFEMEWLYTQNVAAGEQIVVLDLTEVTRPLELLDDELWQVRTDSIVVMEYAADGSFVAGETVDGPPAARYSASIHAARGAGRPFEQWWNAHPEYHRAHWLRKRASA